MQFPEKIPIERIEEYHTHYLGRARDGRQFWGYSTFVYSVLPKDIVGDWRDYRNEYAILHIFDKDGTHIDTKHWLCGTTNKVTNVEIYKKIEELVSELGETNFCDIEVKLFTTLIDGVVFGLVPDKNYGFINLEPNSSIAFGEPWDGSYST